MTRRARFVAGAVAAWLLASALAAGSPVEQVEKKGDAEIRVQLDRDAIELSGFLVLTVTIEGKEPVEIDPIKTITTSKAWLVTPAEPRTEALPKRRMRWQQTFQLSPLQANDVLLPLEPIRFRAAGVDSGAVIWKPFTVKVSTVVASPSLSAIKPILPPEQLPEPPRFPWLLLAAGLGGSLGLTGMVLAVRKRVRRTAPPPAELPPEQAALQELERLEAQPAAAAEQVERFHIQLADVVRRYLDRRCGVHAFERTTREFLAVLDQAGQVPAAQQESLRAFFERCDLAKYARAEYSGAECRVAVRLAREFIQERIAALAEKAKTDAETALPSGSARLSG